jgi:hypothetical protein
MNPTKLFVLAVLIVALPGLGCKKAAQPSGGSTGAASDAASGVEFKLKWPLGRHITETMEIKQNSVMNIPSVPQPMKQDMDMNQTFSLTVKKETEDGQHEVEMEYISTKMKMLMGGKPMLDYDSSKNSADAKNPGTAVLGKLVGSKINFVLDASNHVASIQGAGELMKRLTANGGDPMGTVKSIFNGDVLKQYMEYSQNLPGKPVKPGDSWPVKKDFPMGAMGTMMTDYTFTFTGVEKHNGHDCAAIDMDGTLSSKPNGGEGMIPGMSIAIHDGVSKGKTWFDIQDGMFVDTTMTQDMKMDITIPTPKGAPNAGNGKAQIIEGTMHQVVNTKLESK